jgi:hypothetical protein
VICYRDMTFCGYWRHCRKSLGSCGRELTDRVIADAKEFGLPVAQFAERPECFSQDPNTSIQEEYYGDS